jgi:hypothetical protein
VAFLEGITDAPASPPPKFSGRHGQQGDLINAIAQFFMFNGARVFGGHRGHIDRRVAGRAALLNGCLSAVVAAISRAHAATQPHAKHKPI